MSQELLKQNLAVEPDLQNFIDFAFGSVRALGGNVYAAAMGVLDLVERLRRDGAATGRPLMVCLLLRDSQLFVQWDERPPFRLVKLPGEPLEETVAGLRERLSNSVAMADPEILLQRNAAMMRHFEQTRVKAERELAELQQVLVQRQQELLEFDRQAHTDPLTGLLNRRAFDEKLKAAYLHAMRQKDSPLSLLLLDLDHFKEINDEFGHQYGDAYLNKMAVVLLDIIRDDVDFAFRFGGDEFAVMLYADHAVACEKSRLVLKLMEGKVSIGIATLNETTPTHLTLEEFIRRADDALYEAKRRGRGQTVIATCASQTNGKCRSPCPEMT